MPSAALVEGIIGAPLNPRCQLAVDVKKLHLVGQVIGVGGREGRHLEEDDIRVEKEDWQALLEDRLNGLDLDEHDLVVVCLLPVVGAGTQACTLLFLVSSQVRKAP